ncbi:chitin-binding type-2 domain-containing protein [Trichonephila clavipes]|uniref:Chitin-binding type-2 domain-containing protein n=1 Tax=Trichonephila clavipes TaxID=2585209 RepID=A0A8X6RZA6_TRICX|nr:chitin-binding type-2 domain-containing protein [Trichonephila clavipes]
MVSKITKSAAKCSLNRPYNNDKPVIDEIVLSFDLVGKDEVAVDSRALLGYSGCCVQWHRKCDEAHQKNPEDGESAQKEALSQQDNESKEKAHRSREVGIVPRAHHRIGSRSCFQRNPLPVGGQYRPSQHQEPVYYGPVAVPQDYPYGGSQLSGNNLSSEEYYPPGDLSAIPGNPGVDYPVYSHLSETGFKCLAHTSTPGFYADVETKCQLLDIMIVQFRNEKVSNHGSIPINIDCNVVAFIVFEEGFHQPIKRTKQSVFLDVTVFRHTLVD